MLDDLRGVVECESGQTMAAVLQFGLRPSTKTALSIHSPGNSTLFSSSTGPESAAKSLPCGARDSATAFSNIAASTSFQMRR